jgi:hypothetical protein
MYDGKVKITSSCYERVRVKFDCLLAHMLYHTVVYEWEHNLATS